MLRTMETNGNTPQMLCPVSQLIGPIPLNLNHKIWWSLLTAKTPSVPSPPEAKPLRTSPCSVERFLRGRPGLREATFKAGADGAEPRG